jgi:EAL domain-containing protein (putative c-di-GMP-specific phosphodiesterase class I)
MLPASFSVEGELVGRDDARRQHVCATHYVQTPTPGSAVRQMVALAASCLQFPTVVVNVLDATVQHTIAAVGAPEGGTARFGTWCDAVVRTGAPLIIADTTHVVNIATTAAGDGAAGAYVGVPLTGREGLVIGTLALFDVRPHPITDTQLAQLQAIAAVVEDQLELVRRHNPSFVGGQMAAVELAAAVADGQIVPYYQPVVDLRTGAVVALEALARWHHPSRGVLYPSAFLGLAEDTDIITDLDAAVLTQALHDLAGWLPEHPTLRVNVNLSARQLTDPDCVERITTATTMSGVSPRSVNLEVTETVLLATAHGQRGHLTQLQDLGYRILLDDFGTGFSSIEHVLRLPMNGFKLDRAITDALGTGVGDAVTRALTTLAADLGVSTVIEGVETPTQAAAALRLGCTHAQGFLWAPALPAAQIPDYLTTTSAHPNTHPSAAAPPRGETAARAGAGRKIRPVDVAILDLGLLVASASVLISTRT